MSDRLSGDMAAIVLSELLRNAVLGLKGREIAWRVVLGACRKDSLIELRRALVALDVIDSVQEFDRHRLGEHIICRLYC